MSRAPFAYPLGRSPDGEAGGAADLQTDIMRFMAILALCLMAIFALVQSLPTAPAPAAPEAVDPSGVITASEPVEAPAPEEPVPVLSRPEPTHSPAIIETTVEQRALAVRDAATPSPPIEAAKPVVPETTRPEPEGFTLRFESDAALSRLVATGKVGLFALDDRGAQRMSVAESRISFWAAPVPARYHEMDAATVPAAVRNALLRTGRGNETRQWAVTLPARLSQELERLMQAHRDGALIIAADGTLRREAT
jgi:hypothetical protein